MTRINTNVSSLRGLRNLGKANDLLNTSLTRLSTGLKINSRKDNPSGLIASETLRSQVSAIEQSIKNSSRANNVIATADAALGEVNNLLNQIRGLIQESLNSGALSQSEIEANQLQIDAALSAINKISANTNFAGDRLIDGSKAFITKTTSTDAAKLSDFQVNEALFGAATIEIEAAITKKAEKAELFYGSGGLSTAATIEVSGSKGSQVVFLGGASTTSDIKKAINAASDVTGVVASNDPGAVFEFGATQGFAAVSTDGVAGTLEVTFGTTTAALTLTDARASGSEGANATLGGAIRVAFADASATTTSALAVSSVATTTTGVLITIELAGSAAPTSTVADIVTLINSGTSTNAVAAQAYISAASSGATATATATTAAAAALAGGTDGSAITFTDAREDASVGTVSVQLIEAATTTATLAVSSVSTDSDTGNTTIQITLGRSSGANTSTIADILDLVNDGTSSNAVSARDYISASATTAATASTTIFSAQATASELEGGNLGLNNDITFYDARAYGSEGTISVAFAAPATANSTLSVSVATTTTGNSTITVNLATDADGSVSSTAADIRNFFLTDSSSGAVSARALVNLEYEGDGSDLVAAQTATEIDSDSSILQLTSAEFGKKEFVSINVLGGTFSTTKADYSTESQRDVGEDLQAVINGQAVQTSGLQARIKTTSLDASITFNEQNNVVGTRAVVTVTGGGSLFQIGQEVSSAGQIGIGIEAVNTARLGGISGKLFELGTGAGKSLLDVGSDVPGSTLVNIVEESINRVSTLRGRLGAIQKNVLDTNINSLGVALENISEARSAIVDTDFAESTAELTKAQILSQAGISVLSIANQNPQQVLSLLG